MHHLSAFLICLGFALPLQAQVAKPKVSPNEPMAAIEDFGWSSQGELILKIAIYAPQSKSLELGRLSENKSSQTVLFTTKESYLTIPETGKKLPSLQRLPLEPRFDFGRVKGAFTMEPGEKTTFTGAYPKPPKPQQKPDGKYADYQFVLHLPGNIPPVAFTIPYSDPVP